MQDARNALDYGEQMVAEWLEQYMFKGKSNAKRLAKAVAAHFNDAPKHKSHGRRIDREEARAQGLDIQDLEDSQELQDAVLTLYHLVTIAIEKGPAAKVVLSDLNTMFVKNWDLPVAGGPQSPRVGR